MWGVEILANSVIQVVSRMEQAKIETNVTTNQTLNLLLATPFNSVEHEQDKATTWSSETLTGKSAGERG